MLEWFRNLGATTVAAWWGAWISTAVLIWDIYKHKTRGPRLRVSLRPRVMRHVDGKTKEILNVSKSLGVEVTNTGNGPTTIMDVVATHYESWARRIVRRSSGWLRTNYGECRPGSLPWMIQPGEIWDCFTHQEELTKRFGEKGLFYLGVLDSVRNRPVVKRFRLL